MDELNDLGIDRTLYLARCWLGKDLSEELVKTVVRDCIVCPRIDPAPVSWDKRSLNVEEVR